MNFLDVTGEFLGKIDFAKSKIVQPQRLVFVCGGQNSGDPKSPTSMREILLSRASSTGKAGYIGPARVILAEAAVNFLSRSSFSNLLDLERFIAAAVHAVILIVESPGSMCELGAFVMAPEIREKLIVVMQSDHIPRSSFITNGAIQYFEDNEKDAQVLGYQWSIDKNTRKISIADFAIDAMVKEVPEAMDRVHRVHARETFKKELDGHLIYLTLAFCHMLRAAKQSEIKRCFEFSSIEISEQKLKHCLDILQISDLVKCIRHGKLDYYAPLVEELPVHFSFHSGTEKRDRSTSRWITRIAAEISSDPDEQFRIEMFKGRKNG
ncbi:MAG: retron St85 family effector protein [Rhizobium rhizophilum]|uniref:retron St85 family effector protein n=1 Tax=Rhizobium rhizophilum TaxID=1850373 RepID=UPI00391DDB10